MKFFHLSDLHIGLTLCGRDMIDDQKFVLGQVVEAVKTHKPDAVVIAGDIYDRAVPSAEAIKLCNDFLVDLVEALSGKPVMVISGNHDNCERIDYLSGLVKSQGVYMVGQPPRFEHEHIDKVTLPDKNGNVNFYLLPFVKPSMVKNITGVDSDGRNHSYDETIRLLLERETINPDERNVIVSHQFYCSDRSKADDVVRTDAEIKVVGNIDSVSSSYLKVFDYAALGHIHSPSNAGEKTMVYCGTPLACSVSEAGQKKRIVVVELGAKNEDPVITSIPLVPMHEVLKIEGELEDVIKLGCDDYVSIVLTDKDEGIAQFSRDRVKAAFPNYLDIGVKRDVQATAIKDLQSITDMEPLDFCKKFYPDMTDEDIEIISKIINKVQGV